MHPMQSQLYADHYNFIQLLRFLESELACYEADCGRHPRLSIILDIFDYIQAYPERWHHPLEDEAHELLLRKQVPNSDQIWGLKSEHRKLEKLTHSASELFTSIANDVVVPINELLTITHEFINRQLEHIELENKIAYPLFGEYVSEAEWDCIGTNFQSRNNYRVNNPSKKTPLLSIDWYKSGLAVDPDDLGDTQQNRRDSHWKSKDRALKAEYRNLYKLIMQTEKGDLVGATARALSPIRQAAL